MRLYVYGGRQGAQRAAAAGHVCIVVDALRASATTASLLHYGVQQIILVQEVAQAFAERERYPDSVLVGERGCVRVEGFDLGNSPLQAPEPLLRPTVVFTSSNMSRCGVGASSAPAAFLGTLPSATACATKAVAVAGELGCDITLIPAGAAEDEQLFVLEDYVACGGLLRRIMAAAPGAEPGDDAAAAALTLYAAAQAQGLEETFLGTANGRFLTANGFAADVRFASREDVFTTVPRVARTYPLPGGGVAAVLEPG